jgi:hypothetical protein
MHEGSLKDDQQGRLIKRRYKNSRDSVPLICKFTYIFPSATAIVLLLTMLLGRTILGLIIAILAEQRIN